MGKAEKNRYFDQAPTGGRHKQLLNGAGCKMVEELAGILCTDEEIAGVLGVSVDTLTNQNNGETFTECKKRGQGRGKESLRRMQYRSAEKGSVPMQIWLGKQYLGQREPSGMGFGAEGGGSILFEVRAASTAPKELCSDE